MSAPNWPTRLRAALEYLGLAPFLHSKPTDDTPGFVEGHHRHALALMLSLVGVALLYILGIGIVTIAIMTSRVLYEQYHIEGQTLSLLRKVFLAWAVFWVFSLGTALFGREAYLPVVWRIARRPALLTFAARLWIFFAVLAVCTTAFATYASNRVRMDPAPGKVYFLYENVNKVPRWIFAIGFYPMASAAEERFGPGNVVMLRVDRASMHRALHEATFLFLGTHGTHQGILVPDGLFKIEDVAHNETNPGLQYVYMAGCDQGSGWEEAFKPAQVITYNRLTSVVEHVWWMWFTGPKTICELK